MLSGIPSWIKNKYLLTTLGFTVWMLFFDAQDVITTHVKQRSQLHLLEKSKLYYEEEITRTRTELEELKSDPAILEKYAREKYRMKKDNEDLFIIPSETP